MKDDDKERVFSRRDSIPQSILTRGKSIPAVLRPKLTELLAQTFYSSAPNVLITDEELVKANHAESERYFQENQNIALSHFAEKKRRLSLQKNSILITNKKRTISEHEKKEARQRDLKRFMAKVTTAPTTMEQKVIDESDLRFRKMLQKTKKQKARLEQVVEATVKEYGKDSVKEEGLDGIIRKAKKESIAKTRQNTIISLQLEQKAAKSFRRKLIIHPESRFKVTWDVLLFFLVLYFAFSVPLELGFAGVQPRFNEPNVALSNFFLVVFSVDLVTNFFTAIYEKDSERLILDHKQIAINYLKTWFLIDLVSTLPISDLINLE